MKIAVCVKQVPDTWAEKKLREADSRLDRESADGVMNELDELSIRRQGNRVTFRDRKTIFNLKKEDFQGSPRHKTSINTWEIDCARQTYRLQTMSLFDENGRLITRYSYSDRDLPATPITANTASHYQMKQVCPNR